MRDRIGRNLIRLRNERGQSLLDLAALSQVSDGTLQEVELGRELPIVEVLRKLARALKVSCNASLEEPGKREARPCVDAARGSGKYEANPGCL